MKKILSVLLLSFSTLSMAHGPHYHGHWQHNGGGQWGWVAPAVIGGAVVYAATRPTQPIVVQQQTPPVVFQQQNCSPWTQIQNPDGTVTMTRTCVQY